MSSVHTPSRWQWGYALALAATVVWASSLGQVALPDCADFVDFDKLAHASVFGLMATLVLRPFRTRRLGWAIFIVSLFGAADELHQNFTPGRSMDILDWVADTTGAVVAVGAYTFWGGYRRVLEFKLFKKRKPRVSVSVAVGAPTVPTARAAAPAPATVASPAATPIPPAS
jgi:VanZ family protein